MHTYHASTGPQVVKISINYNYHIQTQCENKYCSIMYHKELIVVIIIIMSMQDDTEV